MNVVAFEMGLIVVDISLDDVSNTSVIERPAVLSTPEGGFVVLAVS